MFKPPFSIQSRIILFVAIVGLAMIVAALFSVSLPPEEVSRLTALQLRATADALNERATEISLAATHLAPSGRRDPVTTPSPGPSDPGPRTSRESPVPLGQTWATPDGLLIRVIAVDFDAWERVRAENQFNSPPAEGMRMVLVSVEVTNTGEGETPRRIRSSDYRLVGDRGIVYTPFDTATRCGVIANELDWDLFGNATVTGNICIVAPQDEDTLRLIYKPGYQWGDEVVYFALDE